MTTGQQTVNLIMCIAYEFILHSREKAGEAVEPNRTDSVNVSDDEGASLKESKGGLSAFTSFVDSQDAQAFEEDEGEAGGLMVREILCFLRCTA